MVVIRGELPSLQVCENKKEHAWRTLSKKGWQRVHIYTPQLPNATLIVTQKKKRDMIDAVHYYEIVANVVWSTLSMLWPGKQNTPLYKNASLLPFTNAQ